MKSQKEHQTPARRPLDLAPGSEDSHTPFPHAGAARPGAMCPAASLTARTRFARGT
jgi:hypothetical protein